MTDSLLHRLRGPTRFLRPDPSEVGRQLPAIHGLLPRPRAILFQPGAGAPLYGFPILARCELEELGRALERCLRSEAVAELARRSRPTATPLLAGEATVEAAWRDYRDRLLRVAENVATSSYAPDYPHIFWLFHSLQVVEALHGLSDGLPITAPIVLDEPPVVLDELRYLVLFRLFDRVVPEMYDLAARLAADLAEREEDLFPALLLPMRDNVLIFTAERIGPGLEQLDGYFRGYLKIDLDDLRTRFAALIHWHHTRLRRDPDMRAAVRRLLPQPRHSPLFFEPGYLTYLSELDGYDPERLLAPQLVRMWESLVLRLKEFELFNELRRLIVRLALDGDRFRCDPADAERIGAARGVLYTRTRPIDFMTPWVVDPEVSRGGLIYDVSHFTATMSRIARSGKEAGAAEDAAYRALFRFQRRFDQLGRSWRLRFEKYLGDGAFYSAMDMGRLLVAAVHMQRLYRAALAEGFPFDRGMRIALNFGDYRLMPFGNREDGMDRYEVFGKGVVELTRLVSGKSGSNLSELRSDLLARGYDPAEVDRFFAPLLVEHRDPIPRSPAHTFAAYIDGHGALINEGIVGTVRFLEELESSGRYECLGQHEAGGRSYVAVWVEALRQRLLIGVRKLGQPSLKGIEHLTVYEIVDGDGWHAPPDELAGAPLLAAVEEVFTVATVGSRSG